MTGWHYLMVAILAEVAGTSSMKYSDGLTRFWPSVSVFACYGLSLTALTRALRHLDISVAYAIWSGLGMVLITLIGALVFREPMPVLKLVSVALIIAGVVVLHRAT